MNKLFGALELAAAGILLGATLGDHCLSLLGHLVAGMGSGALVVLGFRLLSGAE